MPQGLRPKKGTCFHNLFCKNNTLFILFAFIVFIFFYCSYRNYR